MAELIVGGAGEAERLAVTEVTALTIPDARLGALALGPLDAVLWSSAPRAKDGLVGMAVLGRRALHLDFRAARASFGPERAAAPGPADYRAVLERRLAHALAADPDDYEANLALGMLRSMQDRWDDARRLLGWAATLRPEEAEVHYRLAVAEWALGARPAALDEAARAAGLVRGRRVYDRLVRALIAEMADARAHAATPRAEVLELETD
jgi:hypothetical protein